jgi:hypothetical protein
MVYFGIQRAIRFAVQENIMNTYFPTKSFLQGEIQVPPTPGHDIPPDSFTCEVLGDQFENAVWGD